MESERVGEEREPEFLSGPEVARLFGVSTQTIRNWASDKTLPPPVTPPVKHKQLKFRAADINKLLPGGER